MAERDDMAHLRKNAEKAIALAADAWGEIDTLHAHIRALVAAPEVGDMRAALCGLLPENADTTVLEQRLEAGGLGHLAERLRWLKETRSDHA